MPKIFGDLDIPKPGKKELKPNIDLSNKLETQFLTLDDYEKAQRGIIATLKDKIKTIKHKFGK